MDRRTLLLIGLLLLPVTPVHALAKGDAVPDFQRPSLGGQSSVALADYAGQVVYLDFWASWCGPCRLSLPALDAYQEDADAFLKSHPVSYPTLRDADSTLPKRFAVKGMPTAFLIDRDGRVQHVHEGFRKTDIEPLRRKIMALLEE